MPRANKSQSSGKSEKVRSQPRKSDKSDEWAGFVPLDLSQEGKADFLGWFEQDTTMVWRMIEDALAEGLKFSLSYDLANQCFVASLSGRPDVGGVIEFNAILTARSGESWEAIALVVYKHVVLLKGEWWAQLNQPKQNRMSFG